MLARPWHNSRIFWHVQQLGLSAITINKLCQEGCSRLPEARDADEPSHTAWMREVEDLRERVELRMFSPAEISRELETLVARRDSPFSAFRVTVNPGEHFDPFILGAGKEEHPESIHRAELPGPDDATLRFEGWMRSSNSGLASDCFEEVRSITKLIQSWWWGDSRHAWATLLDLTKQGVKGALQGAVENWLLQGAVAVAFCDLDNFKAFNDERGQQEGDRLIQKFAAALSRASGDDALIFSRGGDEFLLVTPINDRAQAVTDVVRIRAEAESSLTEDEPPLRGETQMGVAIGLATSDSDTAYVDRLEEEAEGALKPGSEKQRGRVSIAGSRESREGVNAPLVGFGPLLALSSISRPDPFANLWLCYISAMTAEAFRKGGNDTDAIRRKVEVALETVGPYFDPGLHESGFAADSSQPSGDRRLSRIDVAAAMAHGVLRAQPNGVENWRIEWSTVVDAVAVANGVSGAAIFKHGEADSPETLPIPAVTDNLSAEVDSRSAILVQIGTGTLNAPNSVFADTVYVDDRPTVGGGLPDLWEAALAEIVAALRKFPNVKVIVVTGETANGRFTVEWLHWAEQWDQGEYMDILAAKLGQPTSTIREAGGRISGHVHVVHSEEDLLRVIIEAARDNTWLSASKSIDHQGERPLRRSLAMESMQLEARDGCRVATASEALPVALDIVRGSTNAMIRDRVRRQFVELMDFKVHLTEPTKSKVPRYHRHNQDDLEKYYQREFEESSGKYYVALNEGSQWDRVIGHVAQSIESEDSTRRGVLVVPNDERSADGEVSPLGLIAVRIRPMFTRPGAAFLDFSFTWRTVEALVGLPYSLYASVRFSERLTLELSGLVEDRRIEFSELSYIANSLHMYVDNEYAQNVARLIVNDATQ